MHGGMPCTRALQGSAGQDTRQLTISAARTPGPGMGRASAVGCTSSSDACDVLDALLLSEVVYKRPNAHLVTALRAFHRQFRDDGDSEGVAPRVSRVQPTLDASPHEVRHPGHRYVVAEGPDTVFVCFAGTKDFPRDVRSDVRVGLAPMWSTMGLPAPSTHDPSTHGAHGGFLRRAAGVRIAPAVEYARAARKRLVLCGHSMGGAVALLLSLALLQGKGQVQVQGQANTAEGLPLDVRCIAFAMPPVVSPGLADYAKERGWAALFETYLLPEDLVPRLLGRPSMAVGGVDLSLFPAYAHVGTPLFLETAGVRVPDEKELYSAPQVQLRDPMANLRFSLSHSCGLYRSRVAHILQLERDRAGQREAHADGGRGAEAGRDRGGQGEADGDGDGDRDRDRGTDGDGNGGTGLLPELDSILQPPRVQGVGRGTLADGARVRLLLDAVGEEQPFVTGALVWVGDKGVPGLTRDVAVVGVTSVDSEAEESRETSLWSSLSVRGLARRLLGRTDPPPNLVRARKRWRVVVHASLPTATQFGGQRSASEVLRARVTLLTDFHEVRPRVTVPLRRAKVVLVGAPGSGITALWEALTGETLLDVAGRELVHDASGRRKTASRGLVTYVDVPGVDPAGDKALDTLMNELSGHHSPLSLISSTGAPPEVLVLCHHMAHKIRLDSNSRPALGALVRAAGRQGVPAVLALTHCFAASSTRRLALAGEVADAFGIPLSHAVLVNSLPLEVGGLGVDGHPFVHPVQGVDALHDLVCRLVAVRMADPKSPKGTSGIRATLSGLRDLVTRRKLPGPKAKL